MTFRERLQIDHPELVGPQYVGGCCGHPHDYGYCTEEDFRTFCNSNCTACWDREMPEPDAEDTAEATEAVEEQDTRADSVNHPAHYTSGGVECIEAIKASMSREAYCGYLKGNAIKYIWRYRQKGGVEDLRKAAVYLRWLIEEET